MWRPWFSLTPVERGFLAGICLIFLIGLAARQLHLQAARQPPPAAPAKP